MGRGTAARNRGYVVPLALYGILEDKAMKNYKNKVVEGAKSFDEVRKKVDPGYGHMAGNAANEGQKAKATMEDPTAPKLMKQEAARKKARADAALQGWGHAVADNMNRKMQREKKEGK